jgi:thiol-disulfide isomerase/thioredoxin
LFKGAGSIFPKVDNCLDIHTNEVKTFTVQKGEVTLIDAWATCCGPCQGPMAHNQEMLEKNPEWKGKARIVGLSVDENLEDLKKRIEEKKWDKVDHYQLQNGWEHPLTKEYGIDGVGIPTVILVDKEGVVVFKGYPSDINLEKVINKLINGHSISDVLESPKATLKEKDEVCKALTTFLEENKAIPNKKFYLTVNLRKKVTNENINEDLFEGTVDFCGFEVSNSSDSITKFKTALINLLANYPKFKLTAEYYYKPNIIPKVGIECLKCNSTLDNSVARYFCLVCQLNNKDQFTFCANCIKDDEDFENNPTHEHVLYYLPANTEDQLDKLMNIREKCEKVKVHPEKLVDYYFCNNCDNKSKVIDWSCAICCKNVSYSFDLCNDCYK